ncbi:ABC transporter substrate-binding protein [Paenibacillus macquariensis]|uniref:Carbohydrate ABC transporter substrate-binding protein, CUT1 family n=1 Tax=Paenibacillus macquariensis TaxID=948756 RepID=A0ABY1K2V7_9BACL|nr:extracellular solute-binding protein [Paenibacillus macquariensis]MEC0090267.1 extracellular solute-binding protein [Paenibacillus macquariensis]OAB39628.1 ABC transporter substrate-binding protein [Paenibacillus macquariensis subsp. macquariensis]SIR18429.1 carbohydrate ABC transporter substrate-binding protein, CUT1 family [Paenibacillus macquariensis]
MKKPSLVLINMLLIFTMFLAACGGNNTAKNAPSETPKEVETPKTEDPKPEEPKKDVSLRVFSTFGGTDTAREAFQAALDEFTAKNPNVKINNDTMSANDDGFRTKVNTDMNSGNEPDLLFYFAGIDAQGFVDAGKVVPMNDILDADAEWKNGFTPSALENTRQADGNIYAIPLTGFYEGLFVNKQLFKDNNLELPTDWDKMKKAVQTFAAKGIIPLAAPFDQSHYVVEHFILSAAGPAGQAKGLKDGIDPNWEKGYAAMKELYDLGAFPKDAATIDLGMASNYYGTGKAAMILEGSWAFGGFADAAVKDNTTVIPFPVVPGGLGSGKDIIGGFGSGFYLTKATYDNADKKDAAIALMKHLTSPATIQKIAVANGGTPAANVEITGLAQAANDGMAMAANSTSINNPVDSKIAPETFSTLRAAVQQVVTGKKSPADALKEAKAIEDANKK